MMGYIVIINTSVTNAAAKTPDIINILSWSNVVNKLKKLCLHFSHL